MKEELFENEYIMTKKLIKEYVYNVSCKKLIISGYTLSILGIIIFLTTKGDKNYTMLTMSIISGICALVGPIIIAKQIEAMGKRINNGKIEKTCVKFLDNIVMDEGKAHLEFEYKQIKKIIKTKNLIVLKTSNQSAILVLKNGFVVGNEEEFLNFIKSKKIIKL